ncbi:MAG TPA: ribonuclease domain-containing protein [Burkholderiales bacterium]|jgi:ribonuclease T1|nr:ribonuclease domain-containing protein [Burkholderiales bacterium]
MQGRMQGNKRRRDALLGWLLAVACLLAGAAPALARGPAVDGPIAVQSLPREARATYELILAGGPFPFAKDGITFGNYENMLPRQRRGYYHEFTVRTPGAHNRGARRIVCGAEARDWARNRPEACYYSDNHYVSFRQIRN